MMLNETYTKNIQPRDPERIRSDIETPCATVYNQGVTPVLYDNAVQASSRPAPWNICRKTPLRFPFPSA